MKYIVRATFGLIFCTTLWNALKGQPTIPPIVIQPFSVDSIEWKGGSGSKQEREEKNKS